jgi:hypothetical protein
VTESDSDHRGESVPRWVGDLLPAEAVAALSVHCDDPDSSSVFRVIEQAALNLRAETDWHQLGAAWSELGEDLDAGVSDAAAVVVTAMLVAGQLLTWGSQVSDVHPAELLLQLWPSQAAGPSHSA